MIDTSSLARQGQLLLLDWRLPAPRRDVIPCDIHPEPAEEEVDELAEAEAGAGSRQEDEDSSLDVEGVLTGRDRG